ncbi:hypothetical protein F5884DRAFT_342501 [Xylogone sp. PMI_703]|nr:hypothetical protein F5884DRAFT_342501 [Xylogone sp. PMI_703]
MGDSVDVIPTEKDYKDEATKAPDFIFSEDGKRVGIDNYGKDNYKFMPDDQVYLCSSDTREGPYTVERTENGKYILCADDGNTLKDENGFEKAFEETVLILYDPFESRN